jgi:cell wall-associated NlpC family hydrolase
MKAISAMLAVVLVFGVLATAAVTGALGATTAAYACTTVSGTARTRAAHDLDLDAEQADNAATIIDVAARMNLPTRAAVIAVATALQESELRNLDHGDRDSLGLFQQRPSQGWGTPAQILDPVHAATAFYTALAKIPGWQTLPVTDTAQRVQRSATPGAYARHEPRATRIVATLTADTCATPRGGGTPGEQALAYALAQIGLPYQWGGNGPANGDTGFDCSGLTVAAYATAGIHLPRTAQAQYDAGPLLPARTPLRPGDLLFFGTPTHVHHVGIYTGTHHQMVDAAHTGTLIRTEDYTTWPDLLAATRPEQ